MLRWTVTGSSLAQMESKVPDTPSGAVGPSGSVPTPKAPQTVLATVNYSLGTVSENHITSTRPSEPDDHSMKKCATRYQQRANFILFHFLSP